MLYHRNYCQVFSTLYAGRNGALFCQRHEIFLSWHRTFSIDVVSGFLSFLAGAVNSEAGGWEASFR